MMALVRRNFLSTNVGVHSVQVIFWEWTCFFFFVVLVDG